MPSKYKISRWMFSVRSPRQFIYKWKVKWAAFAYNFGWSKYVFLFDGWIAKCSMAVPIIGYLILFNDSISQHLSFNRLAGEHASSFGLSPAARLKFIYFGLIFLGSSNILYRIQRPNVLRIGVDEFSYVEKALEHFTTSNYLNIDGNIKSFGHMTPHGDYGGDFRSFLDLAHGEDEAISAGDAKSNWIDAKNRYEWLLRSMLIEDFFRNNIKRRLSLISCILLSVAGYVLLAIPSIDLFSKVMVVIFR